MSLIERYRMMRKALTFYANKNNYISQGGTDRVANDAGQMAREVLELTDGPEESER